MKPCTASVLLALAGAPVSAQDVLIIDELFTGPNNRRATISLHIGQSATEIRAVYILFERSGYGIPVFDSPVWRDFFESRSMAFMMIEDYQVSNGPLPEFGLGQVILDALSTFAARPGIDRPTLANAPFFTWGLSRSALWATNMAAFAPDRAAGFISFHMLDTTDLSITTHPTTDIARVDRIPALILAGERDGIIPLGAQQTYNQLRRGRARNAPWTGGIERGVGHTNDALETRIIHPWIDAMLRVRVPQAPGPLLPIDDSDGYLGDLGTFTLAQPDPIIDSSFTIARTPCYPLDPANTSWMPDRTLAIQWQEYFRPGPGPRDCPADIACDGSVDLSDFFEFFNCYDAQLPCADIDGLPGVDLADFFTFFTAFDAGC